MTWKWPALVAGLIALGILLAVLDSTLLRDLFPRSLFGGPRPRQIAVRPPLEFGPGRVRALGGFPDLGPVGGPFSLGWFLTSAAGLLLLSVACLALWPARARVAVERVEAPGTLGLILAAGIVSLLLVAAASVLLRVTFVLFFLVPLLGGLLLIGAAFGVTWLALALGRRLRAFLGDAHPLLIGFTGALVIYDVALVPVAGWIVLAACLVAGVGLVVITRFGSSWSWSLEELNW